MIARSIGILRGLVALLLCTGLAGAQEPKFSIATAPYIFHFPRDHAAHPEYQSEWWYYTGHLRTAAGRRFGYELTFFRFGLRPGDPPLRAGNSRWRGGQLYPAHFAITDEQGQKFFYTERFAREALGMGGAATDRLAVHAGDWTLDGEPLRDPRFERMRLRAKDGPVPTNPRLRPALTFLRDLHLVDKSGLTKRGRRLAGAA